MIDRGFFKSPRIKQVYDYWSGKMVAGRLPARADIHPKELKGLSRDIFMVDVLRDPLSFRIRFFGSRLGEWAGRDYTGFVIPGSGGTPCWREAFDDYRAVVETGAPCLDERQAEWPGREFLSYERIIAPLSDDGDTIDMLFGALEVLGRE